MFKTRRTLWTLPVCALTLATPAAPAAENQTSTDETIELGDITVTSTRVEKSALKVPAAVSAVTQDDIQLGRQQLGLDESMVNIPGLFFQNRYNFGQGLRISIRGFGARSNFGIRGLKIYADGIPVTMGDGQSDTDSIDLGSAQRVEVIRGPTSSLYGASSGGVINVYTEDGTEQPFVSGQVSYGSYNFQKYQVKTGGQFKQLNYLANLSRLNLDGYRNRSKVESNGINSKFRYDFDPGSNLTLTINALNRPIENDPGALTAAEVAANPRQASARNLRYDAGKSVDQQKFGLIYRKRFGEKHEITLRNYYLWRQFANKLPAGGTAAQCPGNFTAALGCKVNNSAQVGFDRFFLGGGGQYIYTDSFFGHHNRFTAGVDIDSQSDDRKRHDNVLGVRGALKLDQTETVDSRGVYLQDEFSILDNVELTAGARYDVVDYRVDDRFFADKTAKNPSGNDSGQVDFDNVSPMVGLLWSPLEWVNLYGNISTAFETPSTTEFANTANNGASGGLNTSLKPQTATNYEAGIKGLITPAHLRYEFVFFHIDTKNEFIPVTLAGAPVGRSFLENAEKTTRDGFEAAVAWQPRFVPGLSVTGSYTYSDFRFDKFTGGVGTTKGTVFDGKRLPGIPDNQFHGEVTYYHPSGWYWSFDMLHVDSLFVDNANAVANENPAYNVANLRAGYSREYGNWEFSPYLGIGNLFDEKYNGNVRINATGGRFFEPAPPSNLYGGVTLRYNFGS